MSAFYDLAFMLGAFQAEADSGDMQGFAFQECVFQYDAFQADVCELVVPGDAERRRGGGYWRKMYVIEGKKYFLTERELAIVVSQLLEKIKRKDIKLDDPVKPQNISRKSWNTLKRSLQALEASMLPEAQPIIREIAADFDEDEELLFMLL